MIQIQNARIALTWEVGAGLSLLDRTARTRWRLDEATVACWHGVPPGERRLLALSGAIVDANGAAMTLSLRCGGLVAQLRFILGTDHVEVRLSAEVAARVRGVSLPGSFRPDGEPLRLLLPIMQGMLWDGAGPAFDELRGEGSHLGFAMPFVGYLAARGGLLLVADSRDDLRWWLGRDGADGRFWAAPVQVESLGAMRYERVTRLYPTGPGITDVAKRYRQCARAAGRFVSWQEKLAQRPGLERLFGALMCFIGYCRDDVDYAAGCAQLRAYGFDRALVYPVRFNSFDADIRMGGEPAIALPREQVAAIAALGYDVAPWSWLNEGLDDGTAARRALFRRDAGGHAVANWAIEAQQWFHVCPSQLLQHQRAALAGPMADITWDHFDVLSCVPPGECYALDHAGHAGRPQARAEERQLVRALFRQDQARGLAVSSESFNDAYALEYDIGSVKAWPQFGPWPFWPVPLTGLVYHDSLLHSWWEVHNYNSHWFGRTAAPKHFEYGGGRPRLMAAADALLGCPPDVFPFGAQYGWTGHGKETFLYRYRLDDPEVQLALRCALPVARLHRRTGPQEMVHFRLLSDDGWVQETAFADGTRVVANFSRDVRRVEAEGVEAVMPESWVEAG